MNSISVFPNLIIIAYWHVKLLPRTRTSNKSALSIDSLMQCKKADTIRCGVVFWLYSLMQASILKVVSALVCAVLTLYVIGVFTSSSNCFYYVHFNYSLCPEFWCESCHFMLWILGGDFITKKEHNYCHFFSRSCYWQPTLLPWLMIRWTQHIHLNQIHTYAYAYQFCFGQFFPFQISLRGGSCVWYLCAKVGSMK